MINAACRMISLVTALWLCAPAVRAEIVNIAWGAGGTFERSLSLVPGGVSELCGPLRPGQSVEWQFESDRNLNFNIHYHEGQAVHYPAHAQHVRQQQGSLAVDRAQDYCWMWTNKSASKALLRVRLRLRQ